MASWRWWLRLRGRITDEEIMQRGHELIAALEAYYNPRGPREPLTAE